MVLVFQKQAWQIGELLRRKIETLDLKTTTKNSPLLNSTCSPGPQTGSRASGRQARSLETSVVWLRQSAAHNWSVTSTQQDSIHAPTRQVSTWPFGNIQIFTRFSACYKNRKAYSRLFTNSILGYGKGRGGLLWRWGL